MMQARVARWLLVLSPACFHPSYNHTACGPARECPSGLACSADGLCEANPGGDGGVDAAIDAATDAATDAPDCLGAVVSICLSTPPSAPVVIEQEHVSTDDSSLCAADIPAYCVIAGSTITVSKELRATGTRPLVLIATESITVSEQGMIDVTSSRGAADRGAGAEPASCGSATLPGPAPTNSGGAGGSFAGRGGNGGTGSRGGSGGIAAETATVLLGLRGGCAGQPGVRVSGSPSVPGHGGGAVYLIAGSAIEVAGTIDASGAGGGGGTAGPGLGAGGGGSGGMIGLSAPMITSTGVIVANGGGGGEASGATPGTSGADPSGISAASGGSGGSPTGGDGGAGAAGAAAAAGTNGSNGMPSSSTAGAGGGGGGGGAGLVRAPAGANLGAQVSPALTPVE